VAGCISKPFSNKIEKINPRASIIGTEAISEIVNVVDKALNGERVKLLEGSDVKASLPKLRENKNIAMVEISSGCLGTCSFCATRFARGKLRSYPPERIVNEIKHAVRDGCKEIWLTSQDNGCYGLDIGTNLAELLEMITSSVKGKYFIRVGMMNPHFVKHILDELIEAYRSRRIYKFIHVPVQSGSDKVLKIMKRQHNVADFFHVVNEFRKVFPSISVWTDVIVGHPGEEEEDFMQTISLLKHVKPDFINVSRFSSHGITEASKMLQPPSQVKKERSRVMTKLMRQLSYEKNGEWLGWKGIALVTEYDDNKKNWIGHNYAYKQVIIKDENKELDLYGKFVKVKIIGYGHAHLEGKILKE
jgi:MiaB-like tRNA modifying enzyme